MLPVLNVFVSVKAAMAAFEAGGKTWKLWSTCVGCGVCAGA
jgi:hypothetical protein